MSYKRKQFTPKDSMESSSKESDDDMEEMNKADVAFEMNGKRGHHRPGRRDTLVRAESKESEAPSYHDEM